MDLFRLKSYITIQFKFRTRVGFNPSQTDLKLSQNFKLGIITGLYRSQNSLARALLGLGLESFLKREVVGREQAEFRSLRYGCYVV